MTGSVLQDLAAEHGTPLLVVDHDAIRRNHAEFRQHLPQVQVYYAVKANPAPEIVRTLLDEGASFDVASLPEFLQVCEHIRPLGADARRAFVRDRIVHANPVHSAEALLALADHRPLLTVDNTAALDQVARHAPQARLLIRLRVPNTGSVCELSPKFGCEPGEAAGLVSRAVRLGLQVAGLGFHVGSQCTSFDNFVQALQIAAAVGAECRERGQELRVLDIGGGFPAPYSCEVRPFRELALVLNAELERLFPPHVRVIAEPGRYLVASAVTAVASVLGKARRDGKMCYYVDDSVYHSFSGVIFDHAQYRMAALRAGKEELCAVFGRTCDGLDAITMSELLPELEIGDLVYAENIGAYSSASATCFNGFAPAAMVHLNRRRAEVTASSAQLPAVLAVDAGR